MIIVSGGIKGGAGKTLLAINLVVMCSRDARDVLLIDADDQESATDFTGLRSERFDGDPGYTSIKLTGKAVRDQVLRLADKYDDIIIDTGGRDTVSQRAALTVADMLLVPFAPRSLDVWTFEQVERLIEEMAPANPELRAYALINRADHQGRDNEEAAKFLRSSEVLEFIPAYLGNRKAFATAVAEGLGVVEYTPRDKKAIAEMETLYQHIFEVEMTSL